MGKLQFVRENLHFKDPNFAEKILTREYRHYGELEEPCHPDLKTLSRLAGATYEDDPKDLPVGWELLTSAWNSKDKYFGAAYYHKSTSQMVIAHRGTVIHDLESVNADIEGIAWNDYTSQMSSAITFSEILMSQLKTSQKKVHLTCTGHSLGGWLAQITTFTLKYFHIEDKVFKTCDEGYHAHTVVFDSPGCRGMLEKISFDYKVSFPRLRYENKPDDDLNLDITVYLSSVNLVNSCNKHFGMIFRIFPKAEDSSKVSHWYSWMPLAIVKYLEGTSQTHQIKQFIDFFSTEKSQCQLKKVLDWPLFTFPQRKKFSDNFFAFKAFRSMMDFFFRVDGSEYKKFMNLAKKMDDLNPDFTIEEYFKNGSVDLHYKVIDRNVKEINCSVFTETELKFFKKLKKLKKEGIRLKEMNQIFKTEDYAQLLKENFKTENGIIQFNSKEDLEYDIRFVKQSFFFQPKIDKTLQKEFEEKYITIFEANYRVRSEDYINQLESEFGNCVNFKDNIGFQEFLQSEKAIFHLFCHNSKKKTLKIETFRILRLLIKLQRMDNILTAAYFTHYTFMNLVDLIKLAETINVIRNLESGASEIDNLLVIECDEVDEKGLTLISKLAKIRTKTKKIVFIADKQYEDKLCNENQCQQSEQCYKIKTTKLSFQDLDEHSQRLLLKKKFIKSGIQKISLLQLLNLNSFEELCKERLDILESFDIETIIGFMHNKIFEINFTSNKKLRNNFDVSFVKIYKDYKRDILEKFLREENKIHEKEIVFLITGLKGSMGTLLDEFLNYFQSENADFRRKIKELHRSNRIMLSAGKDHENWESYWQLCCENAGKVIYWLQLNYNEGNTIKILKTFDRDLYINRKFHYRRIVRKDKLNRLMESINSPCCFIFFNISEKEFQKLFKMSENCTVSFAKSEEDADKLFSESKIDSSRPVCLLQAKTNEGISTKKNNGVIFELKQMSGSLDQIFKWIELDDKSDISEEDLLTLDGRIKIISGDPGMGKSTLLYRLSELFQHYLIIRINLKDVKFEDIPEDYNDEEIVKFLIRKSKSKSNSSSNNRLFRDLLERGLKSNCLPVFLFFDAFDEIQEGENLKNVQKRMIELIKHLEKTTSCKIIITTRKYASQMLNKKLNALAVEFKRITDKDQSEYLKKFWLPQIFIEAENCNEDCKRKLEFYIQRSLRRINTLLDKSFIEWMGIPLQIKMLAEIKAPSVEILQKSIDEVANPLEKIGNVLDLHREFFKKKMKMFYREKNDTNLLDLDMNLLKPIYYDYHIKESFKMIFPEGYVALKELKDSEKLEMTKVIIERINRIGIFQIDQNGKVDIIHKTLAECFVALKLVDWFETGKDIFKSNRNTIHSLFFDKKCKVIRKFLDEADLSLENVKVEYFSDMFQSLWKSESTKIFINEKNETVLHILLHEGCSKAFFQFFFQIAQHGKFIENIINIPSSKKQSPLYLAVQNGFNDIVQSLIKAGANVNEENLEHGSSLLHLAINYGYESVVDHLIKAKANVNKKDDFKRTPLHLASELNYTDIVARLIQDGADINEKDKFEYTSLHIAAKEGHKDIIKLLIQAGGDFERKNKFHNTPLHFAAENGHREIVEFLINSEASVDAKGEHGNTPLHLCAVNGHLDIVQSLIQAKANVDEENKYGETPLNLAHGYGHIDIVDRLTQAGADPNKKGQITETSLHFAAQAANIDTLDRLIKDGANVNGEDQFKQTPLHYATRYGRDDVVKHLINAKANVNKKNEYDETPLHIAAQCGYNVIVDHLINAGANVNAKDRLNHTPIFLANYKHHNDIVQRLVRAGAK